MQTMRFVSVHLLYPVKAPWSPQYTEMLIPRQGYEIIFEDGWLRIMLCGKCVQVISPSMVRCAEVDQTYVERVRIDANATMTMTPTPVELHVTNPEHLKVIEQHAPVQPQKRRGRPPKMR